MGDIRKIHRISIKRLDCLYIQWNSLFQIIFPAIYTVIVYFMTGQPTQLSNFFVFLLVSVLVSLDAQSLGLMIGAATSLQVRARKVNRALVKYNVSSEKKVK